MSKKKRLRKFFPFEPYESSALEEFLGEMALHGWMIECISGNFLTFYEMEPVRLRFAVDLFAKASVFDTKPAEETLDYRQYCKKAGWKFACDNGKVQVFYTDQEDTVPIQTDDRLKMKGIHKMLLLPKLILWIFIPLLTINLIHDILVKVFFFTITNYFMITTVFMELYLLWLVSIDFIAFILWEISAIRNIKNGRSLQYLSYRQVKRKNNLRIGLLLIPLILMIIIFTSSLGEDSVIKVIYQVVGFLIVTCMSVFGYRLIRKNRYSRRANRMMAILFIVFATYCLIVFTTNTILNIYSNKSDEVITYEDTDGNKVSYYMEHDKVPLSLDDLGYTIATYRDSSASISKTFLAQSYDYGDATFEKLDGESIGISYTIVKSRFSWILEYYLKNKWLESSNDLEFKKMDIPQWEAKEVYRQTKGYMGGERVIVVYSDKVIVFESDMELTDEQIQIVKSKLKL